MDICQVMVQPVTRDGKCMAFVSMRSMDKHSEMCIVSRNQPIKFNMEVFSHDSNSAFLDAEA